VLPPPYPPHGAFGIFPPRYPTWGGVLPNLPFVFPLFYISSREGKSVVRGNDARPHPLTLGGTFPLLFFVPTVC